MCTQLRTLTHTYNTYFTLVWWYHMWQDITLFINNGTHTVHAHTFYLESQGATDSVLNLSTL